MVRIIVGVSFISGCKIRVMRVNFGKMEGYCNLVVFFKVIKGSD